MRRGTSVRLGLGLTLALAACQGDPPKPDPASMVEKLATIATDDISKNPELVPIALAAGKHVYDANCASCHGADMKGGAEKHTPDLTDAAWLFAGDDYESGGVAHAPSDIEKTVRYGIRAANSLTRHDADMPALGPHGLKLLTNAEVDYVTEYVLKLSKQPFDEAKAAKAGPAWTDKGSCFDCHGRKGGGNAMIGATNLTDPNLYLYGANREAIAQSVASGRHGVSPAFEGRLKAEEIKAVSVYLFAQVPSQTALEHSASD